MFDDNAPHSPPLFDAGQNLLSYIEDFYSWLFTSNAGGVNLKVFGKWIKLVKGQILSVAEQNLLSEELHRVAEDLQSGELFMGELASRLGEIDRKVTDSNQKAKALSLLAHFENSLGEGDYEKGLRDFENRLTSSDRAFYLEALVRNFQMLAREEGKNLSIETINKMISHWL